MIYKKIFRIIASLSLALSSLSALAPLSPAIAETVISPVSVSAQTNSENPVTGISFSGLNNSSTYLVALGLKDGTAGSYLYLNNYAGLTPSYGYTTADFSNFQEISFTGLPADLNSTIGSLYFHSGNESGSPQVSITVTENQPGLAYFPRNGHFYKVGHFMNTTGNSLNGNGSDDGIFCQSNVELANSYKDAYASTQTLTSINTVSDNCTWSEANRLAQATTVKGQRGYLANITSEAENAFLKDKLNGALNVWMGGTDGTCDGYSTTSLLQNVDLQQTSDLNSLCANPNPSNGGTEGLWHWYDGPEKNQVFWRSTVPYYNVSTISSSQIQTDTYRVDLTYFNNNSPVYVASDFGTYEPVYEYDPLFYYDMNSNLIPVATSIYSSPANFSSFNYSLDTLAGAADGSVYSVNYFNNPISQILTANMNFTSLYDVNGTLIYSADGSRSSYPTCFEDTSCSDDTIYSGSGVPLASITPATFFDYWNYPGYLVNPDGLQTIYHSTGIYSINSSVVNPALIDSSGKTPGVIDPYGTPTPVFADSNGNFLTSTETNYSDVWTVPAGSQIDSVKDCRSYSNSGATAQSRYSSWATPNEPNNTSSNPISHWDTAGESSCGSSGNPLAGASIEDNIVFNWTVANGRWNDLNGNEPTVPYYGYIIEYGDDATPFTGVFIKTPHLVYPQASNTSCDGLAKLQNGGFEDLPSGIDESWQAYGGGPAQYLFVSDASAGEQPKLNGWLTSEEDRLIEIERHLPDYDITNGSDPDLGNVAPASGNYFAEINANYPGTLFQDVGTVPGEILRWSLFHRGRTIDESGGGFDSMKVKIGPTSIDGNDTLAIFTDGERTDFDQIPTLRPDDSGDPTGPSMEDGRGDSSVLGGLGAADQFTSGGHAGGWGYYEGEYVVPAGQYVTRFGFFSISSANGSYSQGNLIDEVKFTPLLACPAHITLVAGRTFTINPFNTISSDGSDNRSSNDSFGQESAIVITASPQSGTASLATINGKANRGFLYTAPITSGTDSISFAITNNYGDQSTSTMTIDILADASVKASASHPFDPRSNQLKTNISRVTQAGDSVLACIDEATAQGNQKISSTLNFSVATNPTIQISNNGTNHLELVGALSDINRSLAVLTIHNSAGRRISNGTRILIRSVLSGNYLGSSYSCSDAAAAGTKIVTLKQLSLFQVRRTFIPVRK